MHNDEPRILVLGGYGNFGKRLGMMLASEGLYQIYIAGRSSYKADNVVAKIKEKYPNSKVNSYIIDWQASDFLPKLKESGANIVIHSAGPFPAQQYTVAKTCLELGMHYLDLADSRSFVSQISELNEMAISHNKVIISGAGPVPGLSSTVVDNFASRFALLREIEFGISLGGKNERGNATLATVLGYLGKPFLRLENGLWKTVYGWQNLHQHYYGDNVGLRWHANVDVPDLSLLPERYPTVKTVVFHAGIDIPILHLLMWQMSWISRAKLIKNWAKFHKPLMAISHWFDSLGTEDFGMYVKMNGSNWRYQPLEINWTLVAEKGDAPFISIVPCMILVRKILNGSLLPGARPCLGMFTLEEFDKVVAKWRIYHTVEETES
jgi:hypothetical protein